MGRKDHRVQMKKMEFQIDTYARIYFEVDSDLDVAEFWASLTQEKLEELSTFAPRTYVAFGLAPSPFAKDKAVKFVWNGKELMPK